MHIHHLVGFFVLALSSSAAAGEPPAVETVQLVSQATCLDSASSPLFQMGPLCTFDGWTATVGEQSIPATHATGETWLPNCRVDDGGACPFAVTATGAVQDGKFLVESWAVAPVGDVTAAGALLVPLDVMCTEEECPQDDPCCHKCNHGGWQAMNRRSEVRGVVAAGVTELPRCSLTGCGECSYRLKAWGVEVGGLFIISSHERTESMALLPAARCTMMACGSSNPCCNTCGFMGWSAQGSTGALNAVPSEGVDPLPACEVDGCGRCPWLLLVDGEEEAGTFVVTSWKRFP